jgi:hypothetical protein
MPAITNIQIANIDIVVSSQNSKTFSKFSSEYSTFIIGVNSIDKPADIHVEIELEDVPHDNKYPDTFFDTGDSWSTYIDENKEYLFALRPPELSGQAVWIARCKRDFKNITMFVYDQHRNTSDRESGILNHFSYPIDQIILMYFLSQRHGAIIHAAGFSLNGKGYIFPGKSGAGKSTLSRQFSAKSNYEFLSDDRIIVRNIDNSFNAFGTPWPGDAGIAMNKSAPLAGIFFISHGNVNRIEKISPQDAVKRLLPVVSIPWYDRDALTGILDFCNDLIAHVPSYIFHFKPEPEAVAVFEKFISA